MQNRFSFLYLILLILIFSNVCTAVAKTESFHATQSWISQKQQLNNLKQWSLSGGIAASGEKPWSASAYWQQSGKDFRITLFGPFGAGGIKITKNNHDIILRTGDGKVYRSDSIADLLQKFNIYLPVKALNYWLRGIPAPGKTQAMIFDEQQRLRKLRQDNWTIYFEKFQRVKQYRLPQTIIAISPDKKWRFRIIISAWNVA